MIRIKQKGDFSKTFKYLNNTNEAIKLQILDRYGQKAVKVLQWATPKDTGKTSQSWTYTIDRKGDVISLSFHNSNIQNGANIAILIQYGHATKNGGWVEGRNYINPAVVPIFDEIAKAAWEEVTKV